LQSEQYLQQSLAISKTLADKPAIAAALEQWGDNERDAQQYNDAENRYLRALYIRHALGDITTTKNLLSKLSEIYQLEKNSVHNAELTDKAKAANRWIEKIDNHDLTGWQDMMQAFD
jgi:hypothetical protein